MNLYLKFLLSLVVGAVCVWFALQKIDLHATREVLVQIPLTAVTLYVATLAATHFFRAWRWQHLLRPIGVSLPAGRLLAISSGGFRASLRLPVSAMAATTSAGLT